jgi:hypothetical protein
MEALVGLGLACNVMQVISFCSQTVQDCSRIRSLGSVEPDVGHIAGKLDKMCNQLERSISTTTQIVQPSMQQTMLLEIARDCRETAGKLTAMPTEISKKMVSLERWRRLCLKGRQ